MALTPEQFKKRLKIAYTALAVLFISMPLSGFVMIVFGLDFPLPFLILPFLLGCMFYTFYLKVSNAATMVKMAKPLLRTQAETAIEIQNEVIDQVDGQKIGRKLGEVLDGIQEQNPHLTTQIIKIRCRACSHLNDETSKFCSECGTQL